MVAVDDVVEALLDDRNLRLELAVDRGKIVRVQHAHVDSAHERYLVAVELVQLQQVHTGFLSR